VVICYFHGVVCVERNSKKDCPSFEIRYFLLVPKAKPLRIPMDFDASLALAMKVKPPPKPTKPKAKKKR